MQSGVYVIWAMGWLHSMAPTLLLHYSQVYSKITVMYYPEQHATRERGVVPS